jgi:hypothetical protein
MLNEKGAITPELTEAMLNALAPEVMNAVRDAQQASSVAPLPPDVEQALQQAEAGATEAPAEEGATPEAEGATPPTEEAAQ